MMKNYYIVSIKHTSKADSALTLWAAGKSGYTLYEVSVGTYKDEDKVLEDDVNVFVDAAIADTLWAKTMYDKKLRHVLRNDAVTREALGLSEKLMLPAKYKKVTMSF